MLRARATLAARGARLASCSSASADARANLLGQPMEALEALLLRAGGKECHAKAVWKEIYLNGRTELEAFEGINKPLRQTLAKTCRVDWGTVKKAQVSSDGVRKYLVDFNGASVETVFIPDETRATVCLSSQVGCSMSCTFCHTGTQKLLRNLSAAEIVAQLMHVRADVSDFPATSERRVTNIVMMGQGEPLYNLRNVENALKVIMTSGGPAIGRNSITLSTSGVVPAIPKIAKSLGVNLAVSLHATNDALRNVLVPINKTFPIAMLLEACRKYNAEVGGTILFEYVMLKDVNDSLADAKELLKLMTGMRAKVNLIPFNPWPGAPYECSNDQQIIAFHRTLQAGGISAPIRWPRGRDIAAACGQVRCCRCPSSAPAV